VDVLLPLEEAQVDRVWCEFLAIAFVRASC
jgi:hypothetical protein